MKPISKRAIVIAILAFGLTPALAIAAPEPLCPGQSVLPTADGRVLSHIPYAEASPYDLVLAPAGFAIGLPCLIQRDAAPDLARMLDAAARVPGIGKTLRGISCFRSVAHQRSVFCAQVGPNRQSLTVADRAHWVGPPGYSEHATGYAIDFGLRPSPGCPDVNYCIAATVTGRWLLAHAREYGFELSFPIANAQRVTWEPWHWRWVGSTINATGAARARLTFARARISFAANPAIADISDFWLTAPRQPSLPSPTAPPPLMPPYIKLPPLP